MNKTIENVIKQFDFEKVHKAMCAVNWLWWKHDRSPTIGELVVTAIDLLTKASDCEVGTLWSTGGLKATKTYDDDLGFGLKLEFVFEETESYEGETDV